MPRSRTIDKLILDQLVKNSDKTAKEVAEDLVFRNGTVTAIARDLGMKSCSVWAKDAILRFVEDTGAARYDEDNRRWIPVAEHDHYQ